MKKTEEGTVTMTFDEYDLFVESAKNCGYRLTGWYPDMDSAICLADDFQDNVVYIIWILESNDEVELNARQLQVRRFLEGEMRKNLTLL